MAKSNPNATAVTTTSSSSAPPVDPTVMEKAICPICYDDLHMVCELLQSIPVCGHVFHESCIRHWTDYCVAGKEPTCPVCKQCYAEHPPIRLYFQSTANSDGVDAEEPGKNPSLISANLHQGAVIRMELRISALDAQVKDVDFKVNRLYRESTNREAFLLGELTTQEQLYTDKVTELAKKTSDCNNLKKKNSSLSKELSALNLETRKLKSRCNILTRSETRTQRKLVETLKLNEELKERIEELQREREGPTRKTLGKRKAQALSSKLYASLKNDKAGSLKNEKAAIKCKAEAVKKTSNTKRTVVETKSLATKNSLVLSGTAGCRDVDDKVVSKKSDESCIAARTRKNVRAARGQRSLIESQKAEVEVALPMLENRFKGQRSKGWKGLKLSHRN